jgi:hypothetical protein
MYMMATLRVHGLTSTLYESLHDLDGDPLEDPDAVRDMIVEFKRLVIEEISLVQSAVQEFIDEDGHKA